MCVIAPHQVSHGNVFTCIKVAISIPGVGSHHLRVIMEKDILAYFKQGMYMDMFSTCVTETS